MLDAQSLPNTPESERRQYPRYPVPEARVSLAVEDASLGESIGIGEAVDLSMGGLRLYRLPAPSNVRLGDTLDMLLIGEEEALALRGEVVHHGTADSYGVMFRDLTSADGKRIDNLLRHLHE